MFAMGYSSVKGACALIVLGMHRSGTSALTGILGLLGADLGPSLEPPSADNQKGYFENTKAVSLNERLLTALGSAWSDVKPLPDRWWDSQTARAFADEIKTVIAGDFGSSPLWALKDPRMCRLSPLWIPAMVEQGIQPRFILMNRHPVEVAGSLGERDGFPEGKSYLLWLSHALESAKWSEGHPRVFVTYDQLLSDWREVTGRIADRLDVKWPNGPEKAANEIERFISPELKRQKHQDNDKPKLPKLVLLTHAALEKAAREGEGGDEAKRDLARLHGELLEGYRTFGALASLEGDLRAEIMRNGEEMDALQEELSRFRYETPKLREAFAFAEKLAYERQDKIAELVKRINELRRKQA